MEIAKPSEGAVGFYLDRAGHWELLSILRVPAEFLARELGERSMSAESIWMYLARVTMNGALGLRSRSAPERRTSERPV